MTISGQGDSGSSFDEQFADDPPARVFPDKSFGYCLKDGLAYREDDLPTTDARNIPNWRDATAYPQYSFMSQWRWEFLRRDVHYRALWDHLVANPAAATQKQIERLANSYYLNHLYDPAICAARADRSAFRFLRHLIWWGEELDEYWSEEYTDIDDIKGQLPSATWKFGRFREFNSGLPLVAINPDEPLRAQFEAIERALAYEKPRRDLFRVSGWKMPEPFRARRDQYPDYLRVWDARAQSVSWSDIQDHFALEGDDRDLKKVHGQAVETMKNIVRLPMVE